MSFPTIPLVSGVTRTVNLALIGCALVSLSLLLLLLFCLREYLVSFCQMSVDTSTLFVKVRVVRKPARKIRAIPDRFVVLIRVVVY